METQPNPPPTHPLEQTLYEVKKTIVGQDQLLERMFVALLARGHLLVEGVPGLAKTMAVKTLAQAIGGEFQRIQFTPDLVPADVIGTRIYNQRDGRVPGLARAGLRQPAAGRRDQPGAGQGAERAARGDAGTAGDHRTGDLPGAEPVPGHGDAEPDRVRGHLPAAGGAGRPLHAQGARRLSHACRGVRRGRADDVGSGGHRRRSSTPRRCWTTSGPRTRSTSTPRSSSTPSGSAPPPGTSPPSGLPELARYVSFGASPRASINMVLGAKALAFLRGRDYALPTDARDLARDVLRHRIVLSYEALADGISADDLLGPVLAAVPPARDPAGPARRA